MKANVSNASKCKQKQANAINASNPSNANYAINASKQTIKQLLQCGLGEAKKQRSFMRE
ncbi:MAG: hypothetical protein GY821_01480 [Gammaproteobacteria bacterium]|nr:hypothetical protein [Gammaproteobacteria bacterium]